MSNFFNWKKVNFILIILLIMTSFCACAAKPNSNVKPKVNVVENDNNEIVEIDSFIFDDLSPYDGSKLRIAFLGDSITYGYKTSDPETMSYPAQLNEMLENRYAIGNFGKNAAYVLDAEDKFNVKKDAKDRSYRYTEEYLKSKEYNPDVVIIMLGINDIRSIYALPEAQDDFVDTLVSLASEYYEQESVKKVYIATSIINHSNTTFIKEFADGPLAELQKKAAEKGNFEVIDIYEMTKDKLSNSDFFDDDNIHLNEKGYKIIAEAFYNFLINK